MGIIAGILERALLIWLESCSSWNIMKTCNQIDGKKTSNKTTNFINISIWLVLSTPLKKMSSSVGMIRNPIYGKHVPNHQSEHLRWLFVWIPLLYWIIVIPNDYWIIPQLIISQQGFSSHCSIGNINHPLWRRPRFFQRQVDKLGAGRSTLGSSGCRHFRCPNKMKVNVGI